MNYCPSTFSLVHLPPPPFPVWIRYTVYKYSTKYVHIKSTTVYAPRRNWDFPPTPHPHASVPPPPVSGGRGTLAGEKGVGRVPIPTKGIHCGTLYMYVLCEVQYTERGGRANQREGYRGNSSQSWVENTNMTGSISYLCTLINTCRKVSLQIRFCIAFFQPNHR